MNQEEEYLKLWRENYKKYILQEECAHKAYEKKNSMSNYPSTSNFSRWHTPYYMTAEDEIGY